MNKDLFSKLLNYYHLQQSDYEELTKDYSLDSFMDGRTFKDLDKVVNLVKTEMSLKSKILIYGDYDADGIMGVSILMKSFNYVNYEADYYVPSRYIDGYGINMEHAKEYTEKGYNLIITVDNGITAFEPIQYLHDHGIKVIVIDHHTPGDHLPVADGFVHPLINSLGEVTSSGAFCAFIFSSGLIGRFDKYLATLASISIVSDIMPLKGQNRNLLRCIFKNYIDDEFYPVSLLADHSQLDENVIGMKIAPRINSLGRIVEDTSINKIINFFVSDNKEDILSYFSTIVDTNELRRNLSKESSSDIDYNPENRGIVLVTEAKEGILGLIANNLVSKYHCPVVVFTKDSSGTLYKGSARSVDGINILDIFIKISHLIETYGGHSAAAGCSIKIENIDEFSKSFYEITKNTETSKEEPNAIQININDISRESYDLIKTFSPFGEGMPSPIFQLNNIKTSSLFFDRTFTHIITTIGNNTKIVGFNFPKKDIICYQYINLIGNIDINEYKGITTTRFVIKEIYPNKI